MPILRLFGLEGEVLNIGVTALIACSYGMPFTAVVMLGGMAFQALGNGFPSMFSSLIRQVLVLLRLCGFSVINSVWKRCGMLCLSVLSFPSV